MYFDADDEMEILGGWRGWPAWGDPQDPGNSHAPPLTWWPRLGMPYMPQYDPVHVGNDRDGGPLFVGRAWHAGHLLPAKVAPHHNGAFVAWDGVEISKFFPEFQVLYLKSFSPDWVEASDGDVPAFAFPVGHTSWGQRTFVGRVRHDGTVTPGRLSKNGDACYISYGGAEIAFKKYEVLTLR